MTDEATTITVFLGCSRELEPDQRELGDFFSELNDILSGHGSYLRLVRWQWDGRNDPLKDYAAAVRKSSLCLFLYFTTAGAGMEERFSEALEAFRTGGRPQIVTWFREVADEKDLSAELRAFRDRLDGELRHFYNTYGTIDSVKLGVLLQIARDVAGEKDAVAPGMLGDVRPAAPLPTTATLLPGAPGLPGMPAVPLPPAVKSAPAALEVKGDSACLWGVPVVSLAGIPAWEGWSGVQDARAELGAMEPHYLNLKARYLERPDDEAVRAEYLPLARRREVLVDEVARGQRAFLDFMLQMSRRTTEGAAALTLRQRAAYRLAEQGKVDAAIRMLDERELADERDRAIRDLEAMRAAERAVLARLRANVSEQLQLARLLRSQAPTPEVEGRVARVLSEAAALEGRYGLGWLARCEHGSNLLRQERFEEALAALEGALAALSDAPRPLADDAVWCWGAALAEAATCRRELGDETGALAAMRGRVELLRAERPGWPLAVADALREAAEAEWRAGLPESAAETLAEALGMLEIPMGRERSEALRSRWQAYALCTQLSADAGRIDEEARRMGQAVATARELVSRPDAVASDQELLALALTELAGLRAVLGDAEAAGEFLAEARGLCERGVEKDFDAWAPIYLQSLVSVGALAAMGGAGYDLACAERAVEVARRLCAGSPRAHAPQLAAALASLALVLSDLGGREEEMLAHVREAADALRRAAEPGSREAVLGLSTLAAPLAIAHDSLGDRRDVRQTARELFDGLRTALFGARPLGDIVEVAACGALWLLVEIVDEAPEERLRCLDRAVEGMERLAGQVAGEISSSYADALAEAQRLRSRLAWEARGESLRPSGSERRLVELQPVYDWGRELMDMDEWVEASEVFRSLLKATRRVSGSDRAMASVLDPLSICLWRAGEREASVAACRELVRRFEAAGSERAAEQARERLSDLEGGAS